MSELEISIIIPVYNCHEYISKCLNSVLEQALCNYEIILIDDGSIDDSMTICREYEEKYSVIKAYKIENRGPFLARKYGASKAIGKYLAFLDADDWIESDTYSNLSRIIDEYEEPDIISFAYRVNEEGALSETFLEEGLYTKELIRQRVLPVMIFDLGKGTRALNPSIACKLIKKSLYMRVVSGIDERITLGEDALVSYSAISLAESLYITNTPYYHYRYNDNSCVRTFTYNTIEELRTFKKMLEEMMMKYAPDNDFSFQIECYVRTFIESIVFDWYGIHRSGIMYTFPYSEIMPNSKIQIYGAGEVGKSYVAEMLQTGFASIVGWYDSNPSVHSFCNVSIKSPESLLETEADYILIAVANGRTAGEIRIYLQGLGIKTEKIVWEKPIMRL